MAPVALGIAGSARRFSDVDSELCRHNNFPRHISEAGDAVLRAVDAPASVDCASKHVQGRAIV